MNGLRKTHYEVLKVTSNTSPAELKRAYRELLLATHPDKQQYTGTTSVKPLRKEANVDEITEAYRILGTENLRKQYDDELLEFGKRNGVYKFGDGVDEVSLDTFEVIDDESDKDTEDDITHFIRKCPRCQVGDGFKLNDDLLEEYAVPCEDKEEDMYQVLIQCESCSLWLKVNFFTADEEALSS